MTHCSIFFISLSNPRSCYKVNKDKTAVQNYISQCNQQSLNINNNNNLYFIMSRNNMSPHVHLLLQ